MILPDFKAFPRTGRIVGVDWGLRRTGLAVSDASREFFFARAPLVAPRGGEFDLAAAVAKFATTEGAVGIIIGLPLHSDGTPSDTTTAVRAFADVLSRHSDLPICFVEENLTSAAAQEELGRVWLRELKQKLDSESARIILENAAAIIRRLPEK